MYTYHLYWIIHPERVLLTLPAINAKISIWDIYFQVLNNQLYIQLKSTEKQTDIYTLKNDLKDIVQEEVSLISYIYWDGYDTEIIRITNLDENIDMTFWIDIPCINKRNTTKIDKASEELDSIHSIINGNLENSFYIRRCFSELNKAIRFPIDTGFHCYRAIESLRKFCWAKYSLIKENEQWEKLKELSTQSDREKIDYIKWFADYARHGNHLPISDKEREKVFLNTWDIVDSFLEYLKNEK